MIAFLHGRLVEALPTRVVIEVHGVGYDVLIPLSSFDKLPAPGGDVQILTHLSIREDAHLLYGFMTVAERNLFRLLIDTVSGIGPKMALNILSGLSVEAFRHAVLAGDVKSLAGVSGVGKKTAERIVVELKDKLGGFGMASPLANPAGTKPAPGPDARMTDTLAALAALGFKPTEAYEAVRAVSTLLGPEATTEQLVRACLKKP